MSTQSLLKYMSKMSLTNRYTLPQMKELTLKMWNHYHVWPSQRTVQTLTCFEVIPWYCLVDPWCPWLLHMRNKSLLLPRVEFARVLSNDRELKKVVSEKSQKWVCEPPFFFYSFFHSFFFFTLTCYSIGKSSISKSAASSLYMELF